MAEISPDITKRLRKISKGSRFTVQKQILNIFSKLKVASHTDCVTKIVISNKKNLLFTASIDRTIKKWSLATKIQLGTIIKLPNPITSIEITKDENFLLACSPPSGIHKIDIDGSTCELYLSSEEIQTFQLSNDSKYLALGSKTSEVKILDFNSKELLFCFELEKPYLKALSFNHDSKFLLYSSGTNSLCIRSIVEHTTKNITFTNSVIYIATGKVSNQYVLGLTDSTTLLLEVNNDNKREVLNDHLSFVTQLEFVQNDERLISAAYDKTIRIYTLKPTAAVEKVIKCISSAITFVVASDMSKIYVGLFNINFADPIQSFQLSTGKLEVGYNGHSCTIRSIVFIKSLNFVLTDSDDGTLRVWDCFNGNQVGLISTGKTFNHFTVSQDEQIVALAGNNEVSVWDLQNIKELFKLDCVIEKGFPLCFFFLQNKYLVFHSSNCYILNISTKEIVMLKEFAKYSISSMLKINEDFFISNHQGGKIVFWEVSDSTHPIFEFNSRHRMRNLSYHPPSKYLVISLKSNKYAVLDFAKIKSKTLNLA